MQRFVFGAGIAILAGMAMAAPANAQVYASAGAGWTRLEHTQVTTDSGVAPGVQLNMFINADQDYSLQGALGFDTGVVRFEGEYRHTANDNVNYDARVGSGVTRPLDGSITTDELMANGYYDFHLAGFTPYIGAGLGAVKGKLEAIGPSPLTPNAAAVTLINDSDTQIGWQLMTGFSVPVMSKLSVTAQFRYFDDGTFDLVDAQGRTAHTEIRGNSIDLGLRWGF